MRYALRQLRLSPGFSLIAILTLALGIGANAAMFSVVDAVLIRPLPYSDAGRLVMVWEDAHEIGFPQNTPSPWNWQTWKRENNVLADIAATRGAGYLLSGDGEPEQIPSRRVTANFWTVLGVKPLIGRVFTEAEDTGNERVAVISHGLWQRRFGGSPDVLNRTILLNDQPFRIIGVMPREFYFLPSRQIELWTPTAFSPEILNNGNSHFLNCIGRLKPGVSLEQAQTAMSALGRQLVDKSPSHGQTMPVLVPIREQLAGKTATSLVVLICASACVLLIACANLANLLLARGAARQREAAVRTALGAGRSRLLAQFLTESLVLAGLGAAAGLALARPAMLFLETLVPQTMVAMKLTLDWRVLAFSAAVAAAALIFGVIPALGGSRVALQQTLREGGRGVSGPRRHWFQHSLIVAQTALAVLLLTCGGFLLQTLQSLRQVELGIRTEKLLTAVTPLNRYSDFNKRAAFVNAILEKVRAIPGVVSAGLISEIPLTSLGNTSGYLLAGQNQADTQGQDALFRVVTRDYFPTVGATLREGRFFQESDRAGADPSAIVNETFANRQFPGRSALGARFKISNFDEKGYSYTIVGVVKEIRERGVSADLKPAVYVVNEQADQAWPVPQGLVIRTSAAPLSIVPAVREAVWSVDRNEPLTRVRTLDNIVDTELAGPSQDSTLLGAFAGLALALACVGLYGVLSYAVAQRTNEIGVRMAFGATSLDILWSFGRQGLTLTVAGLALGLALSVAASRLMSSMLYGFQPHYAAAVAAVSGLLFVVAMVACLFPALRASRIDPIVALRYE